MIDTIEGTLSPKQIKDFHENGYLGPFQAWRPEEMKIVRENVLNEINQKPKFGQSNNNQSRHLDCKSVFDVCSHPSIVEKLCSLLGPNIILWRSHFFTKNAEDPSSQKEVPWHQDGNYWPIEPVLNISAWVAFDEVNTENSCVQIIPGSHKQAIPHIEAESHHNFKEMANPDFFDERKKVNMILKPGEFFIFNEKLLHHSEIHRSQNRRMGLAVRTTVPLVRVDHEKLFPGHKNLVLSGYDDMNFNKIGIAPLD